jgi:hypothetical protein
VQILQDHFGSTGFLDVLKEEQWEEAVAHNHSCLYDDAGLTGILFDLLALLNHSENNHFRLQPLSTLEPGKKRKQRRAMRQSAALDHSSKSEYESELDVSHDNARMCLRSTGSIDVDVLAEL